MWLLGMYALVFTVSESVAVGLLFALNKLAPSIADIVFMLALLAGFILSWPVAVRLTASWDK